MGGAGHFSTVKFPGTAAPSRVLFREIQKGVFQETQIKREYLTLSKACGVPRFV